MDDNNKVQYYPYEEYAEDVDQINDDYEDDYGDNGGRGSKKSVKSLVILLVAVLVVFAVLCGIYLAKNKKDGKDTPANSSDVVTTTEPVSERVTTEAELYQPGEYVVSADGSLRLREEHSVESKHIMSVPNGTRLTITEIYIDTAATKAEEKFWGKTDYKGWTAWVAMAYLAKEGSQPAASTGTDAPVPGVTGLPGETATTSSTGTETTTKKSDSSTGAYSTGKYKVDAEEVGFVRLRESHSVDSESIDEIEYGEEITILEVYHDTDADDDTLEYWGKVSYGGNVGWVAMYYTVPVD